jgi:hypothetical protein
MTEISSVQLKNGVTLFKDERGNWPSYQDVGDGRDYVCEVCPIRKYCGDNNEFDCNVYEMFSGFYLLDEYLEEFNNRYSTDEAITKSLTSGELS